MLFILIKDYRTRATFYSDKRYDSPNINKESKDTKSIDHGVQADQKILRIHLYRTCIRTYVDTYLEYSAMR